LVDEFRRVGVGKEVQVVEKGVMLREDGALFLQELAERSAELESTVCVVLTLCALEFEELLRKNCDGSVKEERDDGNGILELELLIGMGHLGVVEDIDCIEEWHAGELSAGMNEMVDFLVEDFDFPEKQLHEMLLLHDGEGVLQDILDGAEEGEGIDHFRAEHTLRPESVVQVEEHLLIVV
jgi:hypothetical protein